MRERDRELKRETLQQSGTKFVIKLESNIYELISLDNAEDDFLQFKLIHLHFLVIRTHFICCPTHFSLVFQSILYKFIVLSFLGLSPSISWARDPNLVLTHTHTHIYIYRQIDRQIDRYIDKQIIYPNQFQCVP